MYKKRYEYWLSNVTDEELKKQLAVLSDEQIENAFFRELSFGTGGLRGVLGVGTNCMNVYTVDKTTEGICKVLNCNGAKSVVVCYDSRNNSKLFAERAASVFAYHRITVYLTADIYPISFLSYAIRTIGADAGVMITASHNPSIYNGYKVYERDGCQCTDVTADRYSKAISEIDEFSVKHCDFDEAVKNKRIKYIDKTVEKSYFAEISKLKYFSVKKLSVVYTPLYGAGYKVVPKVLTDKGAKVTLVEEQAQPNGNFPTCPYPNPEKREALKLGLEKAKELNAPLLIATDPDCDRVGIAVLHEGEYRCLSGNEVGALLTDFVMTQKKNARFFFKTIVTSDLGSDIAKKHGAQCKDVLTGFKYIGEQIGLLEKQNKAEQFAIGYEESYGYLLTPSFRDKDGVGTCYVICQMVSYLMQQGKTLVDRVNELYEEYGLYTHKTVSYEFGGASGNAKMNFILQKLRDTPLQHIGSYKVEKSIDYLTQEDLPLPKADVLSYTLQSAKVIIRPSGTEPLIKVYFTAVGKENAHFVEELEKEFGKLFKE